jgi:hypothetical protein
VKSEHWARPLGCLGAAAAVGLGLAAWAIIGLTAWQLARIL